MTVLRNEKPASPGAAYAVLRQGGAPPGAARAQLGLAAPAAARLERVFRARAARGAGALTPRFARHAAHVAAVLREGGYPVLAEGRRRAERAR